MRPESCSQHLKFYYVKRTVTDAQDAIEYIFLSLLEAIYICESIQASHFDYLCYKSV